MGMWKAKTKGRVEVAECSTRESTPSFLATCQLGALSKVQMPHWSEEDGPNAQSRQVNRNKSPQMIDPKSFS